jgi:hypothetical protein
MPAMITVLAAVVFFCMAARSPRVERFGWLHVLLILVQVRIHQLIGPYVNPAQAIIVRRD